MKKMIVAGECMVELSGAQNSPQIGYGGDTLNAAIYAARMASPNVEVAYVTRLGSDSFSDRMRAAWANEGLNTAHVAQAAGRTAGLYAIETDDQGERSFTYWRGESPAKELFLGQLTEQELNAFAQADMVFVTGITLAILSNTGRSNLLYAMYEARARGALVGFDANFRPRLWDNMETARSVISDAYRNSGIVFASQSEHSEIFEDKDRNAVETRLKSAGVDEWILRDGTGPIHLGGQGANSTLTVDPVTQPLDTTGAGDAFSGTYLGRRLSDDAPQDAARAAMAVSRRVIQHQGAVIARTAMQDLMS